MLQDFHQAAPDALDGPYDVCIAGTGPAGMSVAFKVADRGGRVLLLEAGGLQPSSESQAVYEGRSAGRVDYGPYIRGCRLRYFGGTSMHWSGVCGVFDEIDFEQRDIYGMPGWPISRADVYKHMDEAKAILGIEDEDFTDDYDRWLSNRFEITKLVRSNPMRFGITYRQRISDDRRIDCFYNANVVDLTLSEDGSRAESLTVRGWDGKTQIVKADRFVIAFGALETPRFLLNANKQMPRGVGNQNDMVGRTFMEHFDLRLGSFVMMNDSFWSGFLDAEGRGKKVKISPTLLREQGLGSTTVSIGEAPRVSAPGRLGWLRDLQRDYACGTESRAARAKLKDDTLVCPGDGRTGTISEHLPNKDSRVTVDPDDVDVFGNPKLVLFYELKEQDYKTIRQTAIELGKTFAEQDIGRFRVRSDILGEDPEVGAHCHHMGTTRMAARPEDGVVDPDCRVFGIDNLYIGGASVFSTGGGVNPTFTLVSLALRLGEHIASDIERG